MNSHKIKARPDKSILLFAKKSLDLRENCSSLLEDSVVAVVRIDLTACTTAPNFYSHLCIFPHEEWDGMRINGCPVKWAVAGAAICGEDFCSTFSPRKEGRMHEREKQHNSLSQSRWLSTLTLHYFMSTFKMNGIQGRRHCESSEHCHAIKGRLLSLSSPFIRRISAWNFSHPGKNSRFHLPSSKSDIIINIATRV